MPEGDKQRQPAARPHHVAAPASVTGRTAFPRASNGREPGLGPSEELSVSGAGPGTSPGAPRSAPSERASTVSFGEFFALLRRRFITFAVCFVLCLVAAFALLQLTPKSYDAESAVKVAPVVASGDTGAAKDISTITESRIVTSTVVAAHAAQTLNYHGSLDDLLTHVSVSSPLNSQLIYITYSASTPRSAANGANAFANAYLAYRRSVGEGILSDQRKLLTDKITALEQQLTSLGTSGPSGTRSALQSQISSLSGRLYTVGTTVVVPGQVVGVAQRPTAPSSPKSLLYVAGGVLFGLIVGVTAAIVRDRRDDDVHGAIDVEHSIGAPVLAAVRANSPRKGDAEPEAGALPAGTLPVGPNGAGEIDAYRTLATKVRIAVAGQGSSSFLLVRGGAAREESAPLNLAAMLARQGLQTALVTTDRGVAQVAALFDDSEQAPQSPDEGLVPVPSVPNLWVLSLGPEEELDSTVSVQRDHIDDVLNLVDVALLDAINLDLSSSTLALGQLTNVAVIAAADRRTKHAELARAIRELAQVDTRPVGGVLYVRDRRTGLRTRGRKKG